MKLKPREHEQPPRELRVKIAAKTFLDVELYAELYREQYGEDIDVPAVAAEILEQFIGSDPAFRRWKRKRAKALPDESEGSPSTATGARSS